MNHRGTSALLDVRFNDWGPYDYHRDFNLTYPFQLRGSWLGVSNRAGFVKIEPALA